MITISRRELLTPFKEFEIAHNIQATRNDIPYKFLGFCPSKYYKVVEMNVERLGKIVDNLFRKLYQQK